MTYIAAAHHDAKLVCWQKTGQYLTVPPLDLKLFVIDCGDSEASASDTCLLIHGFPESSFSFHKVIDGLQNRFKRTVLVDLPGYGFSDKPGANYSHSLVAQTDALLCAYQQLGVRGGHIICHDMGTSIATELLTRFVNQQLPFWFDGGLLSVTFTNGSMVLAYAKLRFTQTLLLNKRLGPLLSRWAQFPTFKKAVLSAHGATGEHALTEQDIRLLWQNTCRQQGHRKNHHVIRYLNDRQRYEQTRWLPSLRLADKLLPIHLCWGDADQVANIDMAHYLKQSVCSNAQLTVMQGAGHFCQIGSPKLWLTSVLPFYQRPDDRTQTHY